MLTLMAPLTSAFAPETLIDLQDLRSAAPSWRHPFGTDPLSRDLWSRVWHGGRYSLLVAFGAGVGSLALGIGVAVVGSLLPKRVDRWLERGTDLLLAMPRLLLLLVASTAFGPMRADALALLLAVSGWPRPARLIRSELRALQARGFVEAARALGATHWECLVRHVLPALVPSVAILLTTSVAQGLLLEAGLSFLGFGVAPPTPTWGVVLQEVGDVFGPRRWLVVLPGLVISTSVAALFRLADALQPALDARRRRHIA